MSEIQSDLSGITQAVYLFITFTATLAMGALTVCAFFAFFRRVYYKDSRVLTISEIGEAVEKDPLYFVISLYGGHIAAGIVVLWLTHHWSKTAFALNIPLGIGWTGTTVMGIACAVGAGVLVAGVYWVMNVFFPPDERLRQEYRYLDQLLQRPGLLRFAGITGIVAVAPLVEEIVFRGAMFSALSQDNGVELATVATTLSFVVCHVRDGRRYWPAFVASGFLGIVTIILRLQFSSLIPCIVAHSVYNLFILFASIIHSKKSEHSPKTALLRKLKTRWTRILSGIQD